MRSIRFRCAAVLLVSSLVSVLWAQEDFGQPISGRPITFDAEDIPPVDAAQNSPLRQQYLELAKTKAELMSDDTLKQEIAATQRNINELKALQKLQEAQEMLLSLTKDFPDSEAAVKATRMLESIQALGPRASLRDELGPALNTASETPFHRSSQSREVPRTSQPPTHRTVPPGNEGPYNNSNVPESRNLSPAFPAFDAN